MSRTVARDPSCVSGPWHKKLNSLKLLSQKADHALHIKKVLTSIKGRWKIKQNHSWQRQKRGLNYSAYLAHKQQTQVYLTLNTWNFKKTYCKNPRDILLFDSKKQILLKACKFIKHSLLFFLQCKEEWLLSKIMTSIKNNNPGYHE